MATPNATSSDGPTTPPAALDVGALATALVQQAQDVILLIDEDGTVRYVNPAVEPATGFRTDEILGKSIMDLIHPDDVERAMFDLSVYATAGAVAGSSTYRVKMSDGSWRMFDASAADVTVDGRHLLGLYGRPDDSASPAVLYGLLRGRSIAEMLRPVCDVINWHIHGSRVGISWHEDDTFLCVGTDLPAELVGGFDDPDTPWATARASATTQRADDHAMLDEHRGALAEKLDLGAYWIEPVLDEHGDVCALVTLWMRADGLPPEIHTVGMHMARDYVELIVRWNRQRRQLDEAAHRDPLTQVANRRAFIEALHDTTAGGGAILYCDLDDFKAVNDALGHSAGDELLRAVARRIQACLRKHDMVARLGGDEFAVLTRGVTRDQVRALADRISASITEPFNVADTTTSVGISIGLAYTSDHLGEAMLERADRGLYRAKTVGINSICWSDDE